MTMTQADAEKRIIELEAEVAALKSKIVLFTALADARNSFIEELLKRIPITNQETV